MTPTKPSPQEKLQAASRGMIADGNRFESITAPQLKQLQNEAGVSYNIASLWKTKAKVQGAEARSRELSAAQEILNDQIRLQVNAAYLNWLNSQKRIDVVAKAQEQATENYRIINNKYKNSLATTTDLLEADVAVLKARMDYLFAKADAVVSYNRLLQSAGEVEPGKK